MSKAKKPEDKQREAWEREYGHLPAEDIVENQKIALARLAAEAEKLAKENRHLKEEIQIARNNQETLKEAIVNCFVDRWITGGRV